VIRTALLLWAVQATPVAGPRIAVEAPELAASQGHVFSGGPLPLTLRIHGGQGRRLDLRVQVFQLAHALAAPLAPTLEVAAGVELGTSAWHEFPFVLDCPALERAVTWELRFQARTDAAGDGTWESAGSARLELHPRDLAAPLRVLARAEAWFVHDHAGALKAFLAGAAIPFSDLDRPDGREAWARARGARRAGDALVLWVRTEAERGRTSTLLDEAPRALVFEAAPAPLALRLEPARTRVTLEPATIARLSGDPRALLGLVEAVGLTRCNLPDEGMEPPCER
jgi:hypothetical protein